MTVKYLCKIIGTVLNISPYFTCRPPTAYILRKAQTSFNCVHSAKYAFYPHILLSVVYCFKMLQQNLQKPTCIPNCLTAS